MTSTPKPLPQNQDSDTPNPARITSDTPKQADEPDELDKILTILFHSYDARGNQLAIDEAKAAIHQYVEREKRKADKSARIDELEMAENQRIYQGIDARPKYAIGVDYIRARLHELKAELRKGES